MPAGYLSRDFDFPVEHTSLKLGVVAWDENLSIIGWSLQSRVLGGVNKEWKQKAQGMGCENWVPDIPISKNEKEEGQGREPE